MVAKQKILIVDDDNNIAELISLYLTKECFETSGRSQYHTCFCKYRIACFHNIFQKLECYINTKVKSACSQSASFGITIFPIIKSTDVFTACSKTDAVYHKFPSPFLWQSITQSYVIQTNETTVVNFIYTHF